MNNNKFYIEAPDINKLLFRKTAEPLIFIAGGISKCPDWQSTVVQSLLDSSQKSFILNPRRKNFDIYDTTQERIQITWEYHALALADAIVFWFPKESICPITLFEYGYWLNSGKIISVGTDLEYSRRSDILIQTELHRYEINVRNNLNHVIEDTYNWRKIFQRNTW